MDPNTTAKQTFLKGLMGRSKSGMTQALFKKTQLNEFELQIDDVEEIKDLTPIRHTQCITMGCLYHLKQLADQYIELGQNEQAKFTCRFCSQQIDLRNFYVDEGLQRIVDEVYVRYNLTTHNAQKIKIDKTMYWTPSLSALEDHAAEIANFRPQKLPQFQDFNEDSLNQLLNIWVPQKEKEGKTDLPLYDYFQAPVLIDQVQQVYQNFLVRPMVMKYAIKYIEHTQRITHTTFKIYYSVFLVLSIDEKQKKGIYKPLGDFQNYVMPAQVPAFAYFSFIYFYEQTWILALANVNNKSIHIFNLIRGFQQKHIDFVRQLFKEQTGLSIQMSVTVLENFQYIQKEQSTVSGCSTFYILQNLPNDLNLVELKKKTMNRQIIETISVKSLSWLLLSTAQMAKPQTPPPILDDSNQEKQSTQPREKTDPRIPADPQVKSNSGGEQPVEQMKKLPEETPKSIDDPQVSKDPPQKDNNFYYDDPPPDAPMGGRRSVLANQVNKNWDFGEDDDKDSYHNVLGKMKEGNGNEKIKLTQGQFVQLLEKLREDVIKEIKYPTQSLADQFIEKKLPQTDLEIQVQTFQSQLTGRPLKQTLSMDEREMKRMLEIYEEEVRKKVEYQKRHGIQDPRDEERDLNDYMQNYQAFQSVLWYYYNYNPDMYQKLIDDYNHRFHNMLLEKLGLGDFYATAVVPNAAAARNEGSRSSNPLNVSSQNVSFNVSKDSARNDSVNMSSNNARGSYRGSILNDVGNQRGSIENFQPGRVYNMNGVESAEGSEMQGNFSTYQNQLLQNKRETREIVAQRYERDVGQSQFSQFKANGNLSENMLNFFIRFIDERHNSIDKDRQKVYNNRILFFTTSFYQYLTENDPTGRKLNFEVVKHYTKPYTGRGNTIFDIFDQILFPIPIGSSEIHLGVIDLTDKKFILYQTSNSKVHEKDPLNSPVLINMMQFIEKETSEKLMKTFNLLQWSFLYGDCAQVVDFQNAPLYVAYLMYLMSNQHTNFQFSESTVQEFRVSLINLFLQIGVTKNLQNQIKDLIENTPL